MVYPENIKNKVLNNNLAILKTVSFDTASRVNNVINSFYNETGLLMYLVSGYRTFEQQWILRKKYLENKGGIAAKSGFSYHNYKLAVDFAIINNDGSLNWNYPNFDILLQIIKNNNLISGASFGDKPHIQNSIGRNIKLLSENNKGWEKYEAMENELLKSLEKKDVNNFASLLPVSLTIGFLILVYALNYKK